MQDDLQVQILHVAVFLVISRDHIINQIIIKAQNIILIVWSYKSPLPLPM